MNHTYKYEDALERLEYIVQQLEKGDLTLEEALSYYEEGVKLLNFCSKMLDKAEGKIQVLIKDLNGNLIAKDFDGGLEPIE